jgi:aspartyl-tRNA(Asn)/glutamyl-tRNA(Gln) amidotransferase subunit A
VAAGEAVWALGTDTGGSVRQPASLCGVVGLKPTYGRISRYGLIAFASSLDTVGTFTRTVRDSASMLQVLAGHDPRDATSLDVPVPVYTEGLDDGVAGLRVGVITEAFGEGVAPPIGASVRAAIDRLEELGASVGEVELPHAAYALSAYYLIAPSECSSNLARYDGVRYGYRAPGEHADSIAMMFATRGQAFGPEVKRRIMLGTYALSAGYYEAYYGQAQKVRTLVIRDYEAAFERFDILVSPTSPTTAFRIGEKADDPMAMYLNDIFTIPANLAGVPAISIPSGLDDAGLPVGIQLTAPALDESTLFRAAHALESALSLELRPPLLQGTA